MTQQDHTPHHDQGQDPEGLELQDESGAQTGRAEADLHPRERRARARKGPLRRGLGAVMDQGWAFFHPPEASWKAPGEDRIQDRFQAMVAWIDAHRGGRALAALVVVILALAAAFVFLLAAGAILNGDGEPAAGGQTSRVASSAAAVKASQLPSASTSPTGESGDQGGSDEAGAAKDDPSGSVASKAVLKAINEDTGLVRNREADQEDPLVTGARFLRAMRTVDTTKSSVQDWRDARDSFTDGGFGGVVQDWDVAGESDATSNAVVTWAGMDAGLHEGRGVAPGFDYGADAEAGTHLVQVAMRLERSVKAGEDRVDTPAGALMEAVVVCPPARDGQRCVVTSWAATPKDFVAHSAIQWESAS